MGQTSRIKNAGIDRPAAGTVREAGEKNDRSAITERSEESGFALPVFRTCIESDIPGIMEMDREAFFDPWSRETWERELRNPSALWLAADLAAVGAGVSADSNVVRGAALPVQKQNTAERYKTGSGRDTMPQRLAGCAGIWLVAGEAQVMRVIVRRELRNRGIGLRLTGELVRQAWALGCDAVTLEVRESNLAARTVYRRCGFTESGIRPHYYADNQEGAFIMWLYRKKN